MELGGHEEYGRCTGKDNRHTLTWARHGNRPGTEELKYRSCMASSVEPTVRTPLTLVEISTLENTWSTSVTLSFSTNCREHKTVEVRTANCKKNCMNKTVVQHHGGFPSDRKRLSPVEHVGSLGSSLMQNHLSSRHILCTTELSSNVKKDQKVLALRQNTTLNILNYCLCMRCF